MSLLLSYAAFFLSLLQPAAIWGPAATHYSCSGKFSFMILANPEEVSRWSLVCQEDVDRVSWALHVVLI